MYNINCYTIAITLLIFDINCYTIAIKLLIWMSKHWRRGLQHGLNGHHARQDLLEFGPTAGALPSARRPGALETYNNTRTKM